QETLRVVRRFHPLPFRGQVGNQHLLRHQLAVTGVLDVLGENLQLGVERVFFVDLFIVRQGQQEDTTGQQDRVAHRQQVSLGRKGGGKFFNLPPPSGRRC